MFGDKNMMRVAGWALIFTVSCYKEGCIPPVDMG